MSRTGSILVAHPGLPIGGPFRRSVIYIYRDDLRGTYGVILNYKSDLSVTEICNNKKINFPDTNIFVHKGGPVNEHALVMLHSQEWRSSSTEDTSDWAISSDTFMLEKIAAGDYPVYFRVFAGVATWAPGQLDLELSGRFPYKKEYAWLTAKATDEILFQHDLDDQYTMALDACGKQMIQQFF